MSAGASFEVVTPAGRVIAEADDLPSARYAAGVLLAEEDELELAVRVAGERHALETVRVAERGAGLAWSTSTLARRYAP